MGYKLCTAEKPSVAESIAKVLGANERKNGYFIGNGYIVTWAVGHLVGLAEPEEYGYVNQDDIWDKDNPDYKTAAYNELPLIPKTFKTVVLSPTKEQFTIMKNLMHREDVDYIIDCGDMGPEGHILQWLIREKAGNKKPVKRFCATSMTDQAIKTAMMNLRDIKDFQSVIMGEYCKKRADWILGMSMSRCASIKYNARIDVGRVQSPTLYFVIKRFMEVTSFKPINYYQLQATFKNSMIAFWLKDTDGIIRESEKDHEKRLLNISTANVMAAEISSFGNGTVSKIAISEKCIERPQLYDITELERDGNRIFGYTAADTLKTAQALYETHKILTYPRTDSRYLTSDLQPYLAVLMRLIGTQPCYRDFSNLLLSDGLTIDDRIINDAKVTDHPALLLTENIKNFDLTALNEKECNILNLIVGRIFVSLSKKYIYQETKVYVSFQNGLVFSTNGKAPIQEGWKEMQHTFFGGETEKADDSLQLLTGVKEGDSLELSACTVLEKKTEPPQLYTEATLLSAMENAGSLIENGSILRGKGIGTQATRATIIKSLFDKNYIKNRRIGKTNYLIPTKQGFNTIRVLPSDLYSPKITADWEEKISKMVIGEITEEDFMNEFYSFISQKVDEAKSCTYTDVDFSYEKEEFAKCPWCGASVYESVIKTNGKEVGSYYCSKKCGFSIVKDNITYFCRTRKNLTASQIKKLITQGFIDVSCVNKNNVAYKGRFTLIRNSKGHAALEFSFANNRK